MNTENIERISTIAEAKKDGNWYQMDMFSENLDQYIRWDSLQEQWSWILVQDQIALIQASYLKD